MKMNIFSRKIVIQRLLAAALVLAGFFYVSACGKYEQVADKLDFLKYEYFTCDAVSVTDGENFVCQTPAMDMQKIELIGISIPEERKDEAKKFCESVLRRGTLVRIEPDKNQKNETGDIPAYVFVPGGKMLNVMLIENGYAAPVEKEVNGKYMSLFAGAAKKATTEENETTEKGKQPWLR
jgi:endonuclease YncB( thermonuclease family)